MEWEEALMAFFLMPNLSQKRTRTAIITVFKPNVNQPISTTIPVAEVKR